MATPPFFGTGSPWRTDISGVSVDANSSTWITNVVAGGCTGMFVNASGFTSALYSISIARDGAAGWARHNIFANSNAIEVQGVPLKSGMFIPSDSDHSVTIYDEDLDVWWNPFGAAALDGNGDWNVGVGTGGVAVFKGQGNGFWNQKDQNASRLSQTAAGGLYAAGMVMPEELDGVSTIHHGFACAIPSTLHSSSFRSPATRSDGTGAVGTYPPAGCWYRLKASFDINAYTSNVYVRQILQALKTYGAIDIDSSGGTAFTLYAPHTSGFGPPYTPGSASPTYPSGVVQTSLNSLVSSLEIVAAPALPDLDDSYKAHLNKSTVVYIPAGWDSPVTTSYPTAVLSDNPIGFWRLDETATAMLATDSTANQNDGSYVGTPTLNVTSPAPADGNAGVTFASASSQCVSIPYSGINLPAGTYDVGDVCSVEIVFKTSTTGAVLGMFSFGHATNAGMYVRVNSGKIEVLKSNTASMCTTTSPTTVADGAIHHLVVTKNGATLKVYVDKVDVTPSVANATLTNSGQNPHIGSDISSGTAAEFFNGTIYEVAAYNTALSPTQVTAHYNAFASSAAASGRYRSLVGTGI